MGEPYVLPPGAYQELRRSTDLSNTPSARPGWKGLNAPQVEQLTDGLHLVPLRPFWPWAPTHFYVAPGLVVHVSSEDGEAFDAWAGATHRSALDPLADLPIDWNRFDG